MTSNIGKLYTKSKLAKRQVDSYQGSRWGLTMRNPSLKRRTKCLLLLWSLSGRSLATKGWASANLSLEDLLHYLRAGRELIIARIKSGAQVASYARLCRRRLLGSHCFGTLPSQGAGACRLGRWPEGGLAIGLE